MKRSILVVDDDLIIQELLRSYLEKADFEVQVCDDGLDALEELEKNNYDLMILDISMPRLNGFETLSKIRKKSTTKNIRVLMLTSSQHVNDIIKATEYGIIGYIIKPPNKDELIRRVEKALDRSSII